MTPTDREELRIRRWRVRGQLEQLIIDRERLGPEIEATFRDGQRTRANARAAIVEHRRIQAGLLIAGRLAEQAALDGDRAVPGQLASLPKPSQAARNSSGQRVDTDQPDHVAVAG